MTATAALLVVLSAATHAYWNFLLKRSGGSQLFVGLSKVGEVVMFAPVFLVLVAPNVARYDGLLVLATVGAAFVLANYVFLAVAYSHGDLSFVYPLARGGILLFLPVLAFVTVGERVSLLGALALAVIVCGIVALQLPALEWRALASLGGRLRSPATMFALLAAFAAACYTIWDKRAVQRVPAFAYIYVYTAITAIAYGAFIWRRHPRADVAAEWRRNRWRDPAGGILQHHVVPAGAVRAAHGDVELRDRAAAAQHRGGRVARRDLAAASRSLAQVARCGADPCRVRRWSASPDDREACGR